MYIDTSNASSGRICLNAAKADQLSSARTITLSGDASGSVNFDGSQNVTLTVDIGALDNINDAIDTKQATITGAATTITGSNLPVNRALISNSSGKVAVSAVTSTELGYLDGVTANIQTQLNNKQDKLTFDSVPTENSTNPVTSGGVYTEVNSAKKAASLAMPGSLKWDGIVGDRECVIAYEEPVSEGVTVRMQFVHVSDYTPEIFALLMMEGVPAEEIILPGLMSTSGIEVDGMHQITPIEVQVADDMFITGDGFAFIPTDGYSLEGIAFPKKGWYFMEYFFIMGDTEIPAMYVNGLQIQMLNFPDTNGGSADKYFESIETEKVYKLLRDANDEGISADGKLYKVSSEVPPISVFSNGYKIIDENSGDIYEVTTDMTTEYIIKDNGIYILCVPIIADGSPFPLILVIPYDGYDLNGVTIPTAGMYTFVTNEITLIGGNGSCEVIKTEHLPEALRFGEITTETRSDTLTWNGNTEGLTSVMNAIYKISDVVPTLNDISAGVILDITIQEGYTIESRDESFTKTSDYEYNFYRAGIKVGYPGGVRVTHEAIIVYPDAVGVDIYGLSFPETGIYFTSDLRNGIFINSLTINGYNGFVIKTTELVKIDPKYLPDDIGGGGSGSGLPEVTVDDNGKSVSVVNGEWVVKKQSYNDLSDKPNYAGSSSAGGAATNANKLTTARTISLNGAVSGSVSFDGSKNVSITTSNGQHISNRGSGTYYYKLGTMVADDSGNYGNITISGRLGGWEQSNSANFDIMMLNRSSARDGNTITATVSASGNTAGAFGNCDIVVYKQDDTSEIVYLKLSGYWLYDFDWSVFQHSINYSATNVTPVGTLVWSLSTAPKTILDTSGDFYIKGSKAATISDIDAAIGAAIAASY